MSEVDVRPVTPTVGAEIFGVDLREPLSPTAVKAIERALLEHHVIFFRNQDISPEQQIAFARQFGEISIPPFSPKYGDVPELIVLDQTTPKDEGADNWHSDNSFMAEPPLGSILKAVQLPALGGDTCFASMYAAYEALSAPMQLIVDQLEAVHDLTKPLQKAIAAGHSNADLPELQAKWPPVVHPVARTHPVTGRKALYVNPVYSRRFEDMTVEESAPILGHLFDYATRPEFCCRISWQKGDLAVWDNRCTQHLAVNDYDGFRRLMYRTAIAGDRPR